MEVLKRKESFWLKEVNQAFTPDFKDSEFHTKLFLKVWELHFEKKDPTHKPVIWKVKYFTFLPSSISDSLAALHIYHIDRKI